MTVAMALVLASLLLTGRAGSILSGAGVALLAGGAAGNLLDRLLHGAVSSHQRPPPLLGASTACSVRTLPPGPGW